MSASGTVFRPGRGDHTTAFLAAVAVSLRFMRAVNAHDGSGRRMRRRWRAHFGRGSGDNIRCQRFTMLPPTISARDRRHGGWVVRNPARDRLLDNRGAPFRVVPPIAGTFMARPPDHDVMMMPVDIVVQPGANGHAQAEGEADHGHRIGEEETNTRGRPVAHGMTGDCLRRSASPVRSIDTCPLALAAPSPR